MGFGKHLEVWEQDRVIKETCVGKWWRRSPRLEVGLCWFVLSITVIRLSSSTGMPWLANQRMCCVCRSEGIPRTRVTQVPVRAFVEGDLFRSARSFFLFFSFLFFSFLSFPFLSFPFLSFPFLSFPFLSCLTLNRALKLRCLQEKTMF